MTQKGNSSVLYWFLSHMDNTCAVFSKFHSEFSCQFNGAKCFQLILNLRKAQRVPPQTRRSKLSDDVKKKESMWFHFLYENIWDVFMNFLLQLERVWVTTAILFFLLAANLE